MSNRAFNTRCRVESPATAQDSTYGTREKTWAVYGHFWCEIQDQLPSRAESVKLDGEVSQNPSRLRLRYNSGIDSSMRLIVIRRGARTTYQIISGPAEVGEKDEDESMIEKISTDG